METFGFRKAGIDGTAKSHYADDGDGDADDDDGVDDDDD